MQKTGVESICRVMEKINKQSIKSKRDKQYLLHVKQNREWEWVNGIDKLLCVEVIESGDGSE